MTVLIVTIISIVASGLLLFADFIEFIFPADADGILGILFFIPIKIGEGLEKLFELTARKAYYLRAKTYLARSKTYRKKLVERLIELGKLKNSVIPLIDYYNTKIKDISNLPNKISIKKSKGVLIMSFDGLSRFVSDFDVHAPQDAYYLGLALNGFEAANFEKQALCVESYVINSYETDFEALKKGKKLDEFMVYAMVSSVRKTYKYLFRLSKKYGRALSSLIEQYKILLANNDKVILEQTDYNLVKTHTDKMFYCTMILLDLCNNHLIINNKINVAGIKQEIRRKKFIKL